MKHLCIFSVESLDTESRLQMELITCISTWIAEGAIHDKHSYCQPIRQQIRIGWWHLMEGRVHKSFQAHMDQHYKLSDNKKNGLLWTSILIQTIWTKIFTPMWNNRNDAVHRITKGNKKSREVLNLNFTIRELFKKAELQTLLFQDRYLLEEKVSHILKLPTGAKRGWILSMQIALRESQKAILAENISLRDSMQRFRESGICRPALPPATQRSSCEISANVSASCRQRKRIKRSRFRKMLPPLLQKGQKRIRTNVPQQHRAKRFKRNPVRKKLSRCPIRIADKSRNKGSLSTIEEEWEQSVHVRKKNRYPRRCRIS